MWKIVFSRWLLPFRARCSYSRSHPPIWTFLGNYFNFLCIILITSLCYLTKYMRTQRALIMKCLVYISFKRTFRIILKRRNYIKNLHSHLFHNCLLLRLTISRERSSSIYSRHIIQLVRFLFNLVLILSPFTYWFVHSPFSTFLILLSDKFAITVIINIILIITINYEQCPSVIIED